MQSRSLAHKGATLHYQTGGQAAAPVTVLLHGGFGSIGDFARYCRVCSGITASSPSTRADMAAPPWAAPR